MDSTFLHTGTWLLPAQAVPLETWACVACDQFTSQPEYWRKAEALVGENPSTLRLILPEALLAEADARVPAIHQAMRDYLAQGVVAQGVQDGFVLVLRHTEAGTHIGLVGLIDLEGYDYRLGNQSPVRATEGTILERIPPRLTVRRGAALETSHVLLLIDDPAQTVLEPLAGRTEHLSCLYDFTLMLGGGNLQGYAVTEQADIQAVYGALHALQAQHEGGILYAVGDGNHSLATAKAYWEELKPSLPEAARAAHPARYAMVEVQNLHSDALQLEPIHRVLFGFDGDSLLEELAAFAAQNGWQLASGEEGQPIRIVYEGKEVAVSVTGSAQPLTVGTLQAFLDAWIPAHPETTLDYVHGEADARALSQGEKTVAFLLPALAKEDLIPMVEKLGALPRKTFSMGEAHQKRYYMEVRALQP